MFKNIRILLTAIKRIDEWIEGCRVVSAADPYGRILGFLDRSRHFFFQAARQIVLTRLSGPRSRPTTQKIRKRLESKPGPLHLWPETLSTEPHSRS
jgi:hypothetical protein